MLLKSQITNVVMHSDDWFSGRLAKFTSSEWHFLMGEKGIPDAGMNYIYRKVGEELTGLPCRKEITTDDTEHGQMYEPEGLKAFGVHMGVEFLVTQKLIKKLDSREGSSPDAIWVRSESADANGYNVFTGEIKCPTSYDKYIHLWNCKTPADLKKVNKAYYWQVMHQMRVCDALRGYFIVYQPFFRMGKLNVIEFKKTELIEDFKMMNIRAQQAEIIFVNQRDKMIA